MPKVTAGPLACEHRDGVLYVVGELSLATAEDLLIVVGTYFDAGEDVLLDLAGVAYIDSVGLSTLIKLHLRAGNRTHSVQLLRPHRHIVDVLRWSGLSDFFGLEAPSSRPTQRTTRRRSDPPASPTAGPASPALTRTARTVEDRPSGYQLHMRRLTRKARRLAASAAVAGLLITFVGACGGDDDDLTDDETDTSVDLDPGAGSGLPGDEDSDTTLDADPGAGSGMPGDSGDETTTTG